MYVAVMIFMKNTPYSPFIASEAKIDRVKPTILLSKIVIPFWKFR